MDISDPSVRALCAALGFAMVGAASPAHAHIAMTSPTPRTAEQKEGPCGLAGGSRGETVAVFEPGETIVVRWTETVNHTSHYRIAFDSDGDDDLVPPADRDDLYNSPAVLVDGIADAVGGSYEQEVTLPDVECERCTLQLIQMMYGSGNYFQCADIALRRGEGSPMADAGTEPSDAGGAPGPDRSRPAMGGCSAGGRVASTVPSLALLLVLSVWLRRPRRGARQPRC